jgi:hypothetical protein
MMLAFLVVGCVVLLLVPYLPAIWETQRREAEDRARAANKGPPPPA